MDVCAECVSMTCRRVVTVNTSRVVAPAHWIRFLQWQKGTKYFIFQTLSLFYRVYADLRLNLLTRTEQFGGNAAGRERKSGRDAHLLTHNCTLQRTVPGWFQLSIATRGDRDCPSSRWWNPLGISPLSLLMLPAERKKSTSCGPQVFLPIETPIR